MNKSWRLVVAILMATLWISVSEFGRNELILKQAWVDHYAALNLDFPDENINGAIWGLWSLVSAILIYVLSRRFNPLETLAISWLAGFVMMWIVTANLSVLPLSILWLAVPLSLLENYLALRIIIKLDPVLP